MAANKSLLLLPGDGIGPEVMSQVKRVIEWMDRRRAVRFEISEDLVGGAAIDSSFAASYNLAQFLGWEWGRYQGPRKAPRFTVSMA